MRATHSSTSQILVSPWRNPEKPTKTHRNQWERGNSLGTSSSPSQPWPLNTFGAWFGPLTLHSVLWYRATWIKIGFLVDIDTFRFWWWFYIIKGFWSQDFYFQFQDLSNSEIHLYFACVPAAWLLYRLAHLPILLELQGKRLFPVLRG